MDVIQPVVTAAMFEKVAAINPAMFKNMATGLNNAYKGVTNFVKKNPLKTMGGLYGGLQSQQALATATGRYDAPNVEAPNSAGWRRAGRTQYNLGYDGKVHAGTNHVAYMRDMLMSPGRTIAESLGYGDAGPESYVPSLTNIGQQKGMTSSPVASHIDPSTGQTVTIHRTTQPTQYRPDIDLRRRYIKGMTESLNNTASPSSLAGLHTPFYDIGATAADHSQGQSPLHTDYSIYNTGL